MSDCFPVILQRAQYTHLIHCLQPVFKLIKRFSICNIIDQQYTLEQETLNKDQTRDMAEHIKNFDSRTGHCTVQVCIELFL